MVKRRAIAIGLALCFVISAVGISAGLAGAAPTSSSAVPAHSAALGSAPHSSPIPYGGGANPLTVRSHWYAGTVLAPRVKTFQARTVSTQLTVPEANISSETNQFYYVLMSVWDNTGSYDQIGMANAFGTWGFTFSFTDYCATNYYFNPDLFALTPGTTYTFTMSLYEGELSFLAYSGQSYVGGFSVITGASTFNVSTAYSCGGLAYYDFTDYEEVYYTQQHTPDFAMQFAGTMANSRTPPMVGFTTPGTPARVQVLIANGVLVIANVHFEFAYAGSSQGLVTLPHSTRTYTFTVSANGLVGSPRLFSCSVASPGWSITGWSGSSSTPFTSSMTVSIPHGTPAGVYFEYLYASTSSSCAHNYTFLTLEVVLT